ncbi:LuxR C-terminal-related transcriptional regulator [Microbacterium sp.]|uniref:LuxR C-terminal-related transcriptional regulator n=1 Tax=Microbacterium sp. TaxID=51671 RepID=UPI00289E9E3D|nr:LuxR C-terminal-related transcriptional regulator [Microbacterium sp.]
MKTIDRRTRAEHAEVLPHKRGTRHLHRARLDEPLTQLLDGDARILTVWSAAGSGKTALLTEWAHRLSGHHPVRWFDGSASLGDETSAAADEWVFIDDAHLMDPGTLTHLFDSAVGSTRRVLATGRFQPVASLAHLAASGALVEVRGDDLAFTPEEASELAALHGVHLGGATATALVTRTAGWATGIALAVPKLLHGDVDDVIDRFVADSRAVGDFLSTEVLDHSSYDEVEVLLAGAVAASIPAELLVELTGRADARLVAERIASENPLLTVRDGQVSFHPVLFAFLQAEGRRRDPGLLCESHGWAALWYAARDHPVEALEHALRSENTSLSRKLVERFGLELVLGGHGALVEEALRALPASADTLGVLVSRLLLQIPFSTDPLLWARLIHDARQHDHPRYRGTLWPTALEAVECFPPDDDCASRELPDLRAPRHLAARGRSLPLDLLCTLAEAQMLRCSGEVRDAMATAGRVVETAGTAGYQWLQLHGAELYSNCAIELEEWEKSSTMEERVAERGITLAPGMSDPVRAAAVIVRASRDYQQGEPLPRELDDVVSARGGTDDAIAVPARVLQLLVSLDADHDSLDSADELERILRASGARFPRLVAASSLQLVALRSTQDELPVAVAFANFAEGMLGGDSLELANVRFILDSPSRSERDTALTHAIARGARSWHPNAVVGASLLLAESAHTAGREPVCISHLTTALTHAKRFRTVRPFLMRGASGARLTALYDGRFGHLNALSSTVARLARVAPAAPGLAVALTPKEHDILVELPVHQSVADIAAGQYLSVNTVKTHLRNIYLKLDATGRSEAVRRATELGLL